MPYECLLFLLYVFHDPQGRSVFHKPTGICSRFCFKVLCYACTVLYSFIYPNKQYLFWVLGWYCGFFYLIQLFHSNILVLFFHPYSSSSPWALITINIVQSPIQTQKRLTQEERRARKHTSNDRLFRQNS